MSTAAFIPKSILILTDLDEQIRMEYNRKMFSFRRILSCGGSIAAYSCNDSYLSVCPKNGGRTQLSGILFIPIVRSLSRWTVKLSKFTMAKLRVKAVHNKCRSNVRNVGR